ncbi:MAG: hypothetical protein KF791_00815 [Verrucomicrobiae bacterium]|nr:hypothetical protein [Verrucomicrobiae bacterium]
MPRILRTILLILGMLVPSGFRVLTQSPDPGQTLDPLALNWPRSFATQGFEFAAYRADTAMRT